MDKFKVYYKEFDSDGNEIASGIDSREYVNYGSAINRARKLYGDRSRFKYEVAWRDPWVDYTENTVCKCCGKSYERPVTHFGYDNSHSLYLSDRRNRRETINWFICPDCYEKIKQFINSLNA